MTIHLRAMTATDVDTAADLLERDGWGRRRDWLAFAVTHPSCDPIVAVEGDTIVGTGVGTRNGPAGWVGSIFVASRLRRRGLGERLTVAVCDGLEAAGCRTLVLVATDAGHRIYERLGFTAVDTYVALEAPPAGVGMSRLGGGLSRSGPAGARATPLHEPVAFTPADLDAAARLDRWATGEDRRPLLERAAMVPGGLVLRGLDGRTDGFVLRSSFRGAATIAVGADEAVALLEARRRAARPDRPLRTGLLASNPAGIERLTDAGWTERYRVPRMERGERLTVHPEAIWGQFSFALG